MIRKLLHKSALIVFLLLFLPASSYAFSVSITPEEVIPGDVVLITITDMGVSSVEGKFNKYQITFYPAIDNSLIALVPVDINAKIGAQKIVIENDGQRYESTIQVRSHKFKTIKLTLPKSKVSLSKKDGERAARERDILNNLCAIRTGRNWDGRFLPPTDTEISEVYGVKRIMNEIRTSVHRGMDYRGKKGTPVKSINSGMVVLTEDRFFGGNTVIVDHGMGLYSIYMHLSKVEVSKGDPVKKGQLVGLIGSTGRVTGPHLHMSVKLYGISINPESLYKLEL